jgi:hypothetical protein
MKETVVPFYFVCPSEMDEELYGVELLLPDKKYEILVDDETEPLPLADAKKFAEKRAVLGRLQSAARAHGIDPLGVTNGSGG